MESSVSLTQVNGSGHCTVSLQLSSPPTQLRFSLGNKFVEGGDMSRAAGISSQHHTYSASFSITHKFKIVYLYLFILKVFDQTLHISAIF